MKTIYLLITFILPIFFFTEACSSDRTRSQKQRATNFALEQNININIISNYFSVSKPLNPRFLVSNSQVQFDEQFYPAKTMTNKLSIINFEKSVVAAIILPETYEDVEIKIQNAYLYEKTLYIRYTISKGEKRSFSIIPQILFSFIRPIQDIESLSFENSQDNTSVEISLY